ncbi:MAG: tetratricopeptide repeat protein [Bacteroidales bacterium]|nr:tetratricopeptide repeat protein [Bacteroidales bacterium]MBN2699616.1 tetratricopeptide repeat protein [Bacteroidales bacterium]
MKNVSFLKVLIPACFVLLTCYCTTTTEDKIPVTTESGKALDLYNQALVASDEVYVGRAMDLLEKALAEDPQFFMAAYSLATFNLYFGNMEAFQKNAQQALSTELKLSKGENLMKQALEKLVEDPDADVTSIGRELVEMYPGDDAAYFQMALFQWLNEDYEGAIDTYTKALEITENDAPIYNLMGYNYLQQEQFDKAEEVFNKYIELAPDLPNAYDSKGDYFLAVGDLKAAYESFMKALEIDSLFTTSLEKAAKVKLKLDSMVVE